jgi:hypothetical protein
MSSVFESNAVVFTGYVALSIVLALWLHEFGHWVAGRIGGSKPEIITAFLIIPYRVKHHKIEAIENRFIRLSGVTPLAWWPATVLCWWFTLTLEEPIWFIGAASTLGAAASMSEGDGIAALSPDKFRVLDKNNEVPRDNLYWSILFRGWISKLD